MARILFSNAFLAKPASDGPEQGEKTKPKWKGSKKKTTSVVIIEEMIRTVAAWLPETQFLFCGDGAGRYRVLLHRTLGDRSGFRETKQYLGMDEPQARKKKAVLRITPFCLWLNSVIKLWFVLETRQARPTPPETDPWYPHKDTISFQDMLGAIRLCFWRGSIFPESTSRDEQEKIHNFVAESLAKVA